MAEFSWAYIDSAAVLSAISGSVTISGSTNISGTLSASALIGDGSGLTNVAATASPAGLNTQIQYNNAGSLGASGNLTWDGSQITVVGNVTASAVSASTFVGNGSGLTNLPASDPFPYAGNAGISGTLDVSGSLSSHDLTVNGNVSASAYIGDGSGLTGVPPSSLVTSMTYHNYNVTNATEQFLSWIHNLEATPGDHQHVGFMPLGGRLLKILVTQFGAASLKVYANFYTGSSPIGGGGTPTNQYYDSPSIGNITGTILRSTPVALDVRTPLSTPSCTGSFSFNSGSTVAVSLRWGGPPQDVLVTCLWEHDTDNMF
jgi:hypothetical protein